MRNIKLDIQEELLYLESFGTEIAKLEDEPAPLGSIKLVVEKLDLNPLEDIKEISIMSYNAKDTIAYINEKHADLKFSINILAHKSTLDSENSNPKIKQLASEFEYTQHKNLIELKNVFNIRTKDTKGNDIDVNTKYLMFLEPYHNGKEFGEFYESKKNNLTLTPQDQDELDLLKARLYIPTAKVVKDIQNEFSL